MTEREPRDIERALEEYVEATQDSPSPGFPDWVMRSIAGEPLPRRGLLASLATLLTVTGPYQRAAQFALLSLLLVAGIGSVAVVGSALDLLPAPTDPSPSPTQVETPASSPPIPSPSPVPTPTPTAAPTPTPAETPEDDLDSPEPDETPEPGETPDSD